MSLSEAYVLLAGELFDCRFCRRLGGVDLFFGLSAPINHHFVSKDGRASLGGVEEGAQVLIAGKEGRKDRLEAEAAIGCCSAGRVGNAVSGGQPCVLC